MKAQKARLIKFGIGTVTIVALMMAFIVLSNTEDIKSPTTSTQEITSGAGSPTESIAVHGHWTIEVRNPDGTLVECRNFENALTSTGPWRLADILSRQKSVGGWKIGAGAQDDSESPFMEPPASGRDCDVREPAYSSTQPWVFNNLTVSAPSSGDNAHKVVLSGTAIAQRDGKINKVSTGLWVLDSSLPPSGTYSGGGYTFTLSNVADVNVSAGQSITFTVVIGFS